MNGFIHRTPFFILLAALVAGIVLAQWIVFPYPVLLIIILIAIIGLSLSFLIKNYRQQFRWRWLFGSCAAIILIAIANILVQQSTLQSAFPPEGMKGAFLVQVSGAPIEKQKSVLYKVSIQRCFSEGKWSDVNKKAYIYLPQDSSDARFDFGDRLLVSGQLAAPRPNGNPEEFDFGNYLRINGVAATGYIQRGNYKWVGRDPSFSIRAASSHARQKLLNVFKKYDIKGDEFAVLSALLLGYTDALTPELRESYSVTGAMHILAVAGLHVGILCGVLYFLLRFMDKRRLTRIAKYVIVIILLWGFAFLTGLAPAVTRTTLMFSLATMGLVLKRRHQTYNTIFFSAFVMLLYDPNYLFNVGFEFSYSAVISIVYFVPKFQRLFTLKHKFVKWVWELICVSVAAQLGIMALSVFYFHRFADYFWLSNMVVVPLAAPIMYVGLLLLAVSPVPALGSMTAFVLKMLLIAINGGVKFIEKLPFAAYDVWCDAGQVLLFYGAVIAITVYFSTKRYAWMAIGLSCLIVLLADNMTRFTQSLVRNEVMVLADNRASHVQWYNGTKCKAITADSLKMNDLMKPFYLKTYTETPTLINGNVLSINGKHFLMTSDTLFRRKTAERKLDVDYLIVANKTRATFATLSRFVNPQTVIIDNTISAWYSNEIKHACDSLRIACIDTKVSGAWTIKLE